MSSSAKIGPSTKRRQRGSVATRTDLVFDAQMDRIDRDEASAQERNENVFVVELPNGVDKSMGGCTNSNSCGPLEKRKERKKLECLKVTAHFSAEKEVNGGSGGGNLYKCGKPSKREEIDHKKLIPSIKIKKIVKKNAAVAAAAATDKPSAADNCDFFLTRNDSKSGVSGGNSKSAGPKTTRERKVRQRNQHHHSSRSSKCLKNGADVGAGTEAEKEEISSNEDGDGEMDGKMSIKRSRMDSDDLLKLTSGEEGLSDLEAENRLMVKKCRKKSTSTRRNHHQKGDTKSVTAVKQKRSHRVEDDSRSGVEDVECDPQMDDLERCEKVDASPLEQLETKLLSNDSVDMEELQQRIASQSAVDGDDDGSGGEDEGDEDDKKKKRKSIRKIMKEKQLSQTTIDAEFAEKERRARIAERQKHYNDLLVQEFDENSPTKSLVTKRLILEKDFTTGDALIEVSEKLITKLKPHQVEAVQFQWDCCFESLERFRAEKDNPDGGGQGCLLAHCMGLGKTLSSITFAHTILKHEKLLGLRTCLVVCPVNTVLNWQQEWEMWFDKDNDDMVNVTELSSKKSSQSRADYLSAWQRNGGVLIIGYDMYRRLASGKGVIGKGAKQRQFRDIFHKTLVNPGPDIIICDEGHLLKSEKSELSKVIRGVRTRRRIVLTGTPLQNNLSEYYTMVSFVKPNLLGTAKEFANRFINPIKNGEHSDSSSADVKIMRLRSHVLCKMLEGSVQRRDYSALTKYLAPKYEYILFVRLSEVQCDLYRTYIKTILGEESACDGSTSTSGAAAGAKLFNDQQILYRVWTHPYALKLHEELAAIRREREWENLEEDDEAEEEEEEEADNFVLPDSDDEEDVDRKSGKKSKAGQSSVASNHNEAVTHIDGKLCLDSENEEEVIKPIDKDVRFCNGEIVRTWSTRSRRHQALRFLPEGHDASADPIEEFEPVLMPPTRPESPKWWHPLYKKDFQFDLLLSGKLTMLFHIVRMCTDIGDKLLVFSQSLLSLDIIERFLAIMHEDPNRFDFRSDLGFNSWEHGKDYYRLDGSTPPIARQMMQERFNKASDHRLRLFLISTRAGGLGINLVAANRVIIFDVSWNPSHDIQSIFRTYRFGQVKPVYVYRLIAQGTMEEKIYDRQVAKQSLSKRVVDEQQIERHFTQEEKEQLYRFEPVTWEESAPRETPTVPKDGILAELLLAHPRWLVRYHVHDSLLENIVQETLTEEERKEAWHSYEEEKRTGLSQAQLEIQKMLHGHRAQQAQQAALLAQQQQHAVLALGDTLTLMAAHFPNEYHMVQQQLLAQQPMLVTAPEQLHQLTVLYLHQQLQQQYILQHQMMLLRQHQQLRQEQAAISTLVAPADIVIEEESEDQELAGSSKK